MDFIDGDGLAAGLDLGPMGAVRGVAPRMRKIRGGERGGFGPDFRMKGKGIALQRQQRTLGADDLEFVGAVAGDVGNENLPHPDILAMAHLVAAAVPIVEIAHHRNALGIGRPDREVHAIRALMGDAMRAHLVVKPDMRALRHQEIVDRPQHRTETVGIGDPPLRTLALRLVFQGLGRAGDRAFQQPARIGAGERAQAVAGKIMRLGPLRPGNQGPDESALGARMRTEQ